MGRLTEDEYFKLTGIKLPTKKKNPYTSGFSSPSRNKYGNVKTETSASKKEEKRLEELRYLQSIGLISELEYQVPFWILPNFEEDGQTVRGIKYVADFVYREKGKSLKTIEDAKGFQTEKFKIKWKFLRYQNKGKYIFKIS